LPRRGAQAVPQGLFVSRRQRERGGDLHADDAVGLVGEQVEAVGDVRDQVDPVLVDQQVEQFEKRRQRPSLERLAEQLLPGRLGDARLAHRAAERHVRLVGGLERQQMLFDLLDRALLEGHGEHGLGIPLGQRLFDHRPRAAFSTTSRYPSTIRPWSFSFIRESIVRSVVSSVSRASSDRSSSIALSRSSPIVRLALPSSAAAWAFASATACSRAFAPSASAASMRRFVSVPMSASLAWIAARFSDASRVSRARSSNFVWMPWERSFSIFPRTGITSFHNTTARITNAMDWESNIAGQLIAAMGRIIAILPWRPRAGRRGRVPRPAARWPARPCATAPAPGSSSSRCQLRRPSL